MRPPTPVGHRPWGIALTGSTGRELALLAGPREGMVRRVWRQLVIPHSHQHDDEYTFVFRGRIGGLVGEEETEVAEGGFLFKPRGTVHALWNPTDEPVVVIELISPAGFEHFFEEMGALSQPDPESMRAIAQKYGQQPHGELVDGLQDRHGVHL